MNFWHRALGPIRNLVRRRDEPLRHYRWINADAPTGIVITPDTALQISVVWACVTGDHERDRLLPVERLHGRPHGEAEELQEDPLDDMLNVRPNPEMPAISFREALLFGALTWGNGYAEIVRNGRGQVTALWPLLPDRVQPRRDHEKPFELYYEVLEQDGSLVELGSEDVFHLRGPGISGLMGDNLVARAAMSMGSRPRRTGTRRPTSGTTRSRRRARVPEDDGDDAHKRLKDDWEDVQGARSRRTGRRSSRTA
jgi:HK97 family phage portal protein